MGTEVVKPSSASVPATSDGQSLPVLVERAGGGGPLRLGRILLCRASHSAHAKGVSVCGAAVPGLVRWAGGRAGRDYAGHGRAIPCGLGGSAAKRNQHLAALRGFFDRLVQVHVVILNPAASVKGVKEQVIEGKTPEITLEQAQTLLGSIRIAKTAKNDQGEEVEIPLTVGLRDRAILAPLAYTVCRAGAVAKLRLQDFQHDGSQYVLRFSEKGGKSREIPVRHDLEGHIRAYLDAAGIGAENKDRPLFRTTEGKTKRLTGNPLTTKDVCRMVKRRLKDAGLPSRLSPHSFRVTGITDLLTQGVPLDDVQYLAGHSSPRTTKLYDRRQKKVTRNIVERISI